MDFGDEAFRASPPRPWARKTGLGHVLSEFRADAGGAQLMGRERIIARQAARHTAPGIA